MFVLTYVTYASLYLTRKPLSIVKSALETDLGVSRQQLGSIDTGFLVCYAVGQFLTGALGDVYGPRRVLTVGYLGSAVAALVFAAYGSGSVWVMVVCWGVNGLTQSGGFPMMIKALNPWMDATNRGKTLGVWTTCQQIGGVLSNSIAGFALTTFGWRSAFTLPAAWVGLCGLAIFALMKESPAEVTGGSSQPSPERPKSSVAPADSDASTASPPTGPSSTSTNSSSSDKGQGTDRMTLGQVLLIPGLMNLGVAYFCIKLVRYTMMMWLPYFLTKQGGYPPSQAAFMSSLFDVGGVLGSIACGSVNVDAVQADRPWSALSLFVCCVCVSV